MRKFMYIECHIVGNPAKWNMAYSSDLKKYDSIYDLLRSRNGGVGRSVYSCRHNCRSLLCSNRKEEVQMTKPKKSRRDWNNKTWVKMQVDKERLEKKPLHRGR